MKRGPDITKGVYSPRTGRIIPWDEWSRRRAGKHKRRKRSYLPGWVGRHKSTRTELNRRERHQTKQELHNV